MPSVDIIDAANVGLLTKVSIITALGAMLLLPGYAILAVSSFGQMWTRFARFALAIGVSVAFYPVLFYNLRFWLPSIVLNRWSIWALLLAFATFFFAIHYRKGWPKLRPTGLGLVALFVVGSTLFTRLWIAHLHPIPAWTDSLHHVLITQLTVQQGKLATTLEPYFPINLTMYHLGLYALSASVEWLTGAASHVALQWTAQLLNGLCGLGIYLVLAPRIGKIGAIGGMITVGLLAHQPAYYVNWGRYTQIASQTIMLIGWAVVLHDLERLTTQQPDAPDHESRWAWFSGALIAGLLSAGVFLLHFRVAALYIALLLASVPWYLAIAYQRKRLSMLLLYLASIGFIATLFILPTLWPALTAYAELGQSKPVITDPNQVQNAVSNYYVFPWASVPALSARPWLLIATGVAAVIGLLRRNPLVVMTLLWVLLIFGIGNAYVLDIKVLKLTNLGTILIMLYMPIGLLIGVAIGESERIVYKLMETRAQWQRSFQTSLVVVLLGAGLYGGWQRMNEIEFGRFFVQEQDLAAMSWVAENTPEDSLIAVNTTFWLPGTPHGIDAGYWLPYFTQREMTVGPMLMVLAPYDYRVDVIDFSQAVVALEEDLAALDRLQQQGVDYIFIGALSQQTGAGIPAEQLRQSAKAEERFEQGGSSVFQIMPE